MTGNLESKQGMLELATFVLNNIECEKTVSSKAVRFLRRTKSGLNNIIVRKENQVLLDKVYGLDGPGRASGNALNTLTDAFILTNKQKYLNRAESLIRSCTDPSENIYSRDLLDTENRWMYTIFLQALVKFIDQKTQYGDVDNMVYYAQSCILSYARWMLENEYLYLERPEKLEYPNETWPAQDLRKCCILLTASHLDESSMQTLYAEKADYFFNAAMRQLMKFDTRNLTRPIAVVAQNYMIYSWLRENNLKKIFSKRFTTAKKYIHNVKTNSGIKEYFKDLIDFISSFSLKKEIEFIKWRIGKRSR
jgi:hypothetical protein